MRAPKVNGNWKYQNEVPLHQDASYPIPRHSHGSAIPSTATACPHTELTCAFHTDAPTRDICSPWLSCQLPKAGAPPTTTMLWPGRICQSLRTARIIHFHEARRTTHAAIVRMSMHVRMSVTHSCTHLKTNCTAVELAVGSRGTNEGVRTTVSSRRMTSRNAARARASAGCDVSCENCHRNVKRHNISPRKHHETVHPLSHHPPWTHQHIP